MDSSTEQAGGPLEGATDPEVTPLRRTPVGAPTDQRESVACAMPEAPVMPPAAAAVGDGEEEEFVVRRRPAQRRVSVPTATDFTSERLLRPRAEAPRSGLRRAIYRLSGGRVNLGPSPGELAEREMVARAKARVAGCRRIAVMSRKGGVGKTTTTLQLGHTFASHRGDRVIAADDDPSITEALREQDFYSVVDLLEHHYNLVLMDTGTGVLESATKGIVALADQLVVVSGASLDTARTAMSTLDWLAKHGHTTLVENAVAVINQVRPDSQLDLDRVQ
jgi:putative peptide zinc metalloprotease protein